MTAKLDDMPARDFLVREEKIERFERLLIALAQAADRNLEQKKSIRAGIAAALSAECPVCRAQIDGAHLLMLADLPNAEKKPASNGCATGFALARDANQVITAFTLASIRMSIGQRFSPKKSLSLNARFQLRPSRSIPPSSRCVEKSNCEGSQSFLASCCWHYGSGRFISEERFLCCGNLRNFTWILYPPATLRIRSAAPRSFAKFKKLFDT